MYLKRLDLQGFKSFPEKIKLEFNPGVTAVVGPNGSGKSNVSDAVRWVLGEQRARSLRGDKMEDVIFAGTETRKPLGFAEVSILIDNEDQKLPLAYTEVQISRRVFRSGESEYRINGTLCRLKDIQELFMDTGVGREGYSIIGQGRIDEILSAKGEERRRIFEEAAGIVKYKTRKNEAMQKLEKEQQNLLRVDDIIRELEVQVEPLRQQSEKAERYLELTERLKHAEAEEFSKAMTRMEKQLEKLQTEETAAQKEMQDSLLKSTAEREKTGKLRTALEVTEHTLQKQNEAMVQLRAELEKAEGEIRLTELQKQNTAENISRIQDEMQQKKAQLTENKAEQELLESRRTGIRLQLEQQQKELDVLEKGCAELSTSLHQEETKAESFKEEIFEQIRVGTEAKGEISKREAMQEQFLARQEQLLQEKGYMESRLQQLQVHLEVLEKQEAERKEAIADLEQEMHALGRDRAYALEQKTKAEAHLSKQEKKVSETRSRLSLLTELEKEHEGFHDSVKSLLNLPDSEERGICGAVASLLKVEEVYETAIEVALGNSLQNIVTETEEDAKNAIEYLKQNRLGRATFLPISAVKGKTFQGRPEILSEAGILGTAFSLVSYEEKYEQIAMNLLGRILVVQDLEKGIQLAKKYRYQYKMVTLAGEFLNNGGAITGGSIQKKALHIFGRSREIRQLQEALEKLEQEIIKQKEKLHLAQEDLQEIEEETLEKKMELQKLMVTGSGSQVEWEKTEKEKKEANEKHALLLLEETQLKEQLEKTETEIRTFRKKAEEAEKSMAFANEQLTVFQNTLSGGKEERDAMLGKITQKKLELSQAGQELYQAEEALQRFLAEETALAKDLKKAEEQISFYEAHTDTQHRQQEELHKAAEDLAQRVSEMQKQIGDSTAEKSRIAEESKTTEEASAFWKEKANGLANDLFRISAAKEKQEDEKQRYTARIWEEYEMTLRMAREYLETAPPMQEKRPVKEWKNEIRLLGPVNTDAIGQYQEVKERYTFLTAQRTDILEAEKKLQTVIKELSKQMEKQFKEQFALISENFETVFQEMFGGGKAYLKLTNPEKVLESAIEIVAQPPGKNLQNLQLLSGGERALTAIAILFSILKLKPSPFCILDEIEAALDDANVTRYAKYLKRFAEETQFIVITHRKGTMEHADVLYGVTMQEKGVSKLISVTFSEAEKTVAT